jgi:hypothetical protein
MLITIVILGAAGIAAVAYFAAWIFPAGKGRQQGASGRNAGARPDVAPAATSYVHAMPSKEES